MSFPSIKEVLDSLGHSITRRLVTVVFSVYIILTITITLGHMYVDYATAKQGIINELNRFEKIIRGGLVEALWNYDTDQVRALLLGSMNSTVIIGAEVSTSLGEELSWRVGHVFDKDNNPVVIDPNSETVIPATGLSKNLIKHESPMTYIDIDGKEFKIGVVSLYSSSGIVFDNVKVGYVLILINATIKTLALWIFFLWAGYVYLSRPLAALTRATVALSSGAQGAKVEIDKKLAEGTEVAILASSFNAMVDRLDEANIALIRTQKRLESVINAMPVILVGLSDKGIISDWNSHAEMISGKMASEAIGKPIKEIFPPYEKYMSDVISAIENNHFVEKNKEKELIDDEYHYFDIMVYPVITKDYAGAAIVIDDITEQVNLEQAMAQSEKMSSIGGLAAGVAHEINNPIGAIVQAGQNVIRRLDKNIPANQKVADELGVSMDKIHEYLESRKVLSFIDGIRDSGQRAASIVSDLLQFTKRGVSDKSEVNLGLLVDKAIDLTFADHSLQKFNIKPEDVRIDKIYDPNLKPVFCSAKEIENAMINILKNALYYVKKVDRTFQIIIQLKERGDNVEIEIEDNGPGMEETALKKAFEPFFTTKEVGEGAGLGLAVAYSIIVDDHHGQIKIESTPEKGTKVIIQIPIKETRQEVTIKTEHTTSRGAKH